VAVTSSISSILGPGGAIAKAARQLRDAAAAARNGGRGCRGHCRETPLDDRSRYRSRQELAYLVPAILAALADKKFRIVVSTHTISLQEQLVRKDIPFLQRVMPASFKRSSSKAAQITFRCAAYAARSNARGAMLAEASVVEQLERIGRWSKQTPDGSRSDLDFRPLPEVWEQVESDSGNCLGRKCGDYGSCFYFKARRQMHSGASPGRQSRLVFQRSCPAAAGYKHSPGVSGRHSR